MIFPVDGPTVLTNCESLAIPPFEVLPPPVGRDGVGERGLEGVFGGVLLLVAMPESKVIDEKI